MVGLSVAAQRRRALRLAWWRYRRPALLAGAVLAVLVGYRIAAPGGPELVPVPVAAHDLAAGSVVGAGDVRTVSWPASAAPEGLLPDPAGRTLAGPLRVGEAITDTRVVGRSLLAGQPAEVVAVAVRLADSAGSALVRPGDRVDVLAATGSGGSGGSAGGTGNGAEVAADRVATAALVLSSPAAGGGSAAPQDDGLGLLGGGAGSGGSGGSPDAPVLVLAVDPGAAGRLASAQGDRLLSVVLLPGAPDAGR